jgi:hypothetical protein
MSPQVHLTEKLLTTDTLFANREKEKIWEKYCGFLDLSVEEFMTIQSLLLREQLELLSESRIGEKVLGGHSFGSVAEFRAGVPLTNYDTYKPYFEAQNDRVLPRRAAIWAHTSGRLGLVKWAPYTTEMLARLADDTLAAFILSSAGQRGDVRLQEGARVVLNLPPLPYTTGIMGVAAAQRIPYQAIPPLNEASSMSFEDRIKQGYKTALHTGVDYAASIAVVLNKVGETFSNLGANGNRTTTYHPMALLRTAKAIINSKLHKRSLLPRDFWKVKGLVCGGTDTVIYRDQIFHYWGVQPLDVYVATEACFIAMQNWNKKGMTFVPYSNFYEFIPEPEMEKSRQDPAYQPKTLLLDELEAGHEYELVITNLQGGAFVRYRIGDIIKITSLGDPETGVRLPQMVFQRRADDIIDISGFVRLDEKLMWQAIHQMGHPYVDWTVRKESIDGEPKVHVYIEFSGTAVHPGDVAARLDENLAALFSDYADLRHMLGINPVAVTVLESGAFQNYQRRKQAAGFDLAHLKPPHMNPTDQLLADLLNNE